MPNDKDFALCPDCKHDHCVLLEEDVFEPKEPAEAIIHLVRIDGTRKVVVEANLANADDNDPVRKLYVAALKAIMNINQGAGEDVVSEKDSMVGGEGYPSNLGIS